MSLWISVPVVTSLMSSAALWQPSTSRWVQVDSSLAESTLNTRVSTPCLVPERRPNVSSESSRGELFPGPEWTSLGGERKKNITCLRLRKMVINIYIKECGQRRNYYRSWKQRHRVHRREKKKRGKSWLICSATTNVFQMSVILWRKMSNSYGKSEHELWLGQNKPEKGLLTQSSLGWSTNLLSLCERVYIKRKKGNKAFYATFILCIYMCMYPGIEHENLVVMSAWLLVGLMRLSLLSGKEG